jgi:hypothetical protein
MKKKEISRKMCKRYEQAGYRKRNASDLRYMGFAHSKRNAN